jgi:hypothetical protein
MKDGGKIMKEGEMMMNKGNKMKEGM